MQLVEFVSSTETVEDILRSEHAASWIIDAWRANPSPDAITWKEVIIAPMNVEKASHQYNLDALQLKKALSLSDTHLLMIVNGKETLFSKAGLKKIRKTLSI